MLTVQHCGLSRTPLVTEIFHKKTCTISTIYRVFGLNLTVDVFFVKSNIYRRKKQIFSKIERC